MKDTIITSSRKKKELILFGACVLIALILNIVSIIKYNANWSELFTSLFYVAAFSIVLYIVAGIIRLVYFGIRKMVTR
jgi:hypothetical protein